VGVGVFILDVILIGEDVCMPTFLVISKHSPESCPMTNEKMKKAAADLMSKIGELSKKHGVKLVGVYNVIPEHFGIQVFEAPNFEALMKLAMEPEIMKFTINTITEVKMAMTLEETLKMLK
jgi:uncharacterized protein with GYD domain